MSDMALFDLLPGFHRSRDAENGDPLRLLLGVLETELAALKANIALLYDSWFIDSCPDWAVPYIADLVGLDEAMTGTDSPGLRALVANTVGYQRRRGTLATLGHVASAITGWPALAEDLDARMVRSHGFGGTGASGSGMAAGTLALRGAGQQLTGQQLTGQQLRGGPRGHPLANEPAGGALASLRGGAARVRQAGRAPAPHPAGVVLRVWRLQTHALLGVEPRALGQGRYTVHPMGIDTPLFTVCDQLPIAGRALTNAEMPQPLTRVMLAAMLVERTALPVTIRVREDGQWRTVPPDAITAADLRSWPAEPPAPPDAGRFGAPQFGAPQFGAPQFGPGRFASEPAGVAVLLDPELGRLVLSGMPEAVAVDHATGAARAMGGGAYGRGDRLVLADPATWIARVGPASPATAGSPVAPERTAFGAAPASGARPAVAPLPPGETLTSNETQPTRDSLAQGEAWAPGDSLATARRADRRHHFASLGEALAACPARTAEVLIEIADNRIHRLSRPPGEMPTGEMPTGEIPTGEMPTGDTPAGEGKPRGLLDLTDPANPVLHCGGSHVAIQAMDGFRPCVEGVLTIDGGDTPAQVVISGVWWRGGFTLRGEAELMLLDSSVWPQDGPAVLALPRTGTQQSVLLAHSVTGPLRLPGLNVTLAIRSSIVDGRGAAAVAGSGTGNASFGPAPVLDHATLFGDLVVGSAGELAPGLGDSLITGSVITRQANAPLAQPPSAGTPTDLLPRAVASFRSRRFGHPAYAVPADDCPAAITRGAADGGELGAFHACRNGSRVASLARVIDDYLPEGMSAQFVFMT